MKIAIIVVGAIALLLGGLWLVQGLGIVTIQPILCVAECEALEGPSTPWAVTGLVVAAAGAAAIFFGLRWRKQAS